MMNKCRSKSQSKYGVIALLVIALMAGMVMTGCGRNSGPDVTEEMDGYTHLSPEDAATFVENASNEGALIVDVRGDVAFEQGHIPGAISTWYEDYDEGRLDVLPDLNQKILVYCDFGGLSKEVAEKLVAQGYTNVYEFKGMEAWAGEVEVDEKYQDLEEIG